jgi:PAS domain S-box-containing protein
VVIVDDSPEDRADLRRLLLQGSSRHYVFVEARNAEEGRRAILEAPAGFPDCVILDYHLPDADAPEVLAELAGPDGDGVCPVVVVTGSGGQDVGRAVLRAGAQDFVGKGWMSAESLTRAVENAAERWAMAVELRDRNARLRLALEATKTGIWTWNLITGSVTWTPECYEIHGLAPGTFDETSVAFFRLVHPDDRARQETTVRAAIDDHTLFHSEFRVVRPGGEVLWVENVGRASYDASGRPLRMLGTITDIGERKRAQELAGAALDEAQRAVRTRDELISLVSHDLKSPLTTLALGISFLEEDADAAGRAVLKKMARQTERMNSMIDELVDAALLHSGMPIGLVLRETDLVSLVRAVVEELQEGAPLHRLEVQAARGSLVGMWDPQRLDRVVNNLLSNAVKYSPEGGRVEIDLELTREGDTIWALLRVTDEGIGIGPSDQERVFEWYSRGENALRTEIPGTGIGLAGSRDIVVQHGGSISVESEPGKGSTFTVRLPTEPRGSTSSLHASAR